MTIITITFKFQGTVVIITITLFIALGTKQLPLTNILYVDILQADKIEKLIKAAKVDVEPFWPGLFAKALEGHGLDSLIQSAGAPGAGGAAPAAGGAAAGGGEAEAKEEEKKEEKKPESDEESDDDMGFGELLKKNKQLEGSEALIKGKI